MKKENITHFTLNPESLPKVDWSHFDALSAEEKSFAAESDDECPPATAEQLSRVRRHPNLKAIRNRLQMTQEQFAHSFLLSLGTVRDWEQGLHLPDMAGRAYLQVIAADPHAVLKALGTTPAN